MFLVDCPHCGHRELRSTCALLGLANTADGIEYAIRCGRCALVVRSLTGRRARPRRARPAA